MSLFHSHHWQETRRYFVPPVDRTVKGTSAQFARDLANGYTVVELHCIECGDVSSRNLPGDATTP